jgi:hypothetical protein
MGLINGDILFQNGDHGNKEASHYGLHELWLPVFSWGLESHTCKPCCSPMLFELLADALSDSPPAPVSSTQILHKNGNKTLSRPDKITLQIWWAMMLEVISIHGMNHRWWCKTHSPAQPNTAEW